MYAKDTLTVATVLTPVERQRVDAAGSGVFAVVHRDTVPEAARVVKDAHGNVLADGDIVAMIKDLKLGGG